MTENDHVAVYTLAQLRTVEAILLRLVVMLPEREKHVLKALARDHLASRQTTDLFQPASDEELAIADIGRKHAYAAIFGEAPESGLKGKE
jgi:hypothetical protein